jgi:hypothetical protein
MHDAFVRVIPNFKTNHSKNISQQIASAPLYLFEIFEPLPLGFSGVD